MTGKAHFNVLRDIDNLLESLNSDLSLGFKTSTYEDATGKSNRQFVMDRDSTFCLIAGYDASARMRIIKRWQELEAQAKQGFQLPNFMDPEESAEAWLKEYRAKQALALENHVRSTERQQAALDYTAPRARTYDEVVAPVVNTWNSRNPRHLPKYFGKNF